MSTTPGTVPERTAVPAWRQKLASFWRWWTGEIVRLVPERFGGLTGASRAPLVRLEDETLALLELRGAALVEASRSPLASLDPEGRRIALRNLLAGANEQQMRVRLALARGDSLLRRVSLPLATEENLAQVLAFEMDRLSPFRAEDVYFGYRIAGRDAAAAKVHVDLGVARRALVDDRVARLRDWGASVQGVVLEEDVVRSPSPVDLLPESQRGEREGGMRRLQLGLAAAVLALFALVLAYPLWQKREAAIALMPTLTKAESEAKATDALRTELDRNVADFNFLLSKKHASQPVLAFVEELSRLLPDSTWVQQLDIRPQGKLREIQIAGETPSSSKLIEIFEQSATMRNAAPRGSVTRGSQPGTERFLIAAEAKPRALPDPVPVTVAAVPVPQGLPASAPPVQPAGAPPATATVQPAGAPPATATVQPAGSPATAVPPGATAASPAPPVATVQPVVPPQPVSRPPPVPRANPSGGPMPVPAPAPAPGK